MTVSDVQARPPDNPPPGDEWKPMPGVMDWYQFSHRGFARSLDHETNGRPFEGKVLNPRRDGDGYAVINITLANGARKNGASLARCILLAHAGEPPDPEMQACHGPGGQLDNRWPENLRWDTPDANREEALALRLVNNPPKPKPLKTCVRCSGTFDGPGRRCHRCVVQLGEQAAYYLAEGSDLEAVAQSLDYPHVAGLFRLAKRYGGLRCVVVAHEGVSFVTGEGKSAHARSLLQRVMGRRSRGGDVG